VLTFRDYLTTTDHSVAATPNLRSALALNSDAPSSPFTFTGPENQASDANFDGAESDAWVLKHINVAHVQPLIEAMDEDGSGFISVQEANKFALSRPKGMRYVPCIPYTGSHLMLCTDCCIGLHIGRQVSNVLSTIPRSSNFDVSLGWHYNITDYRSKIYGLMQKLHKISSNVLVVNRKLVAIYLDDWDYFRIEGILRHIGPLASNVSRDTKLVEVSASIAAAQEERLKKNLNELSYVLRSSADVALVIGNGRLETVSLPNMSYSRR
jgi:hypothetical protein